MGITSRSQIYIPHTGTAANWHQGEKKHLQSFVKKNPRRFLPQNQTLVGMYVSGANKKKQIGNAEDQAHF